VSNGRTGGMILECRKNLKYLNVLTQLRSLSIRSVDGCNYDDEVDILAKCTTLERLSLYQLDYIKAVKHLPLKRLKIKMHGYIYIDSIVNLERIQSLQTLHLVNIKISLETLSKLPNLTNLKLFNFAIKFKHELGLTKLESNYSHNTFKSLKFLPSLTKLVLWYPARSFILNGMVDQSNILVPASLRRLVIKFHNQAPDSYLDKFRELLPNVDIVIKYA
jgi:hypothetical protein